MTIREKIFSVSSAPNGSTIREHLAAIIINPPPAAGNLSANTASILRGAKIKNRLRAKITCN